MNELRFDGRVAIVTGAGRGLGAEYARALAARGASVVVNDLGTDINGRGADARPAEQVVAGIVAAGGAAVASAETVGTTDGAEAIVRLALERYGRLDVLVNNAGIRSQTAFPETDIDDFTRHIDVHLSGAFSVTRAAWPHFVDQAYGRVLMITSSAVFGLPGRASYPAAKAGQVGLVKSLALAVPDLDLKVNAVAPLAHTRMRANATALPDGTELPLEAGLVSAAVVLLVHESCPVNGEVFGAGGGRVDRIFVGATKGYVNPALTPEDLRDNWECVMDESEFWLPADAPDHAARLRQARAALLA